MLTQLQLLGCQLGMLRLTSVIPTEMMTTTTVLGLGVELHLQSTAGQDSQLAHNQGLSASQRQGTCQHQQTSRGRQPYSGRQLHSSKQQV